MGAWLFWLVAMVVSCQFWGVQSLRFVFAGVVCAVGAFYFGLWVVGKVVSRGWTLDLGGLNNLGIKSCKISSLSSKVSCRKGILFWCCWVMLCVRIGEASHPGPGEHTQTWSVGLCNPNGIQGKLDQLEMLPGQVWFMCETHLSKLGMVQFKKNLRLTKSRFRYFVGGAPCAFRSQEAVGTCSGVATIASVPARVLPHSITPELFSTGRIQVSGFCMNQHWIQAAVVYGYPDSAKHVERTHMTECLVSEAIDRVALGAVGLRMIVGDFNHSCKELQQLKRLGDLGFVEAQNFALFRWGVPIKSTCRREEPIDQVWLSPEMQSLLDHVEISDCDWSDHSSVICHFSSNFVSLSTFHWRMPDAFQWPELDDTSVNVDWVANPTAAYAAFWHGVETEAKTKVPSLSQKALGRGMTLESKITSFQVPPCKVARHGEFQPKFYGASLSYLRWVKQLRRIQALRRLMVSQSQNPMHHIRKVEVWSAIRNAPGFPCGFCHWWSLNFVEHRFSTQGFPVGLPSLCDIRSMAVLFQAQVEKVEGFQKKSRISAAKARREDNFQLLFQDCADERPSKVDTMIQSCHANIETVHPEDCSVVLEKPAELIAGHPVVVAGQPKQVLMACHDQVWLDSVGNIAEGDCLVQEIVHSSDAEILQQFEQVWAARWIKLSHLEPGKWDRVLDFVKGRFKPVAWNFPTWSTEMFRQNVVRKKTRAAVGPDGVSKHDLQNLPDSKAESLVKLFQLLESGKCVWPDQLTTGFVSSLYKGRGNGGVDSFRPITVFPMVYRVWSSTRARQAMHMLASILPHTIRGGVPCRESRTIWYELAQIVEASSLWHQSAQGLVLDVCKAFNAIPRDPVWGILKHLAFPTTILMPWAKFVFQAKRRFKVRASTGQPVGSCVGFPEGCGLSVFAMTILDWLVSEWMSSLVGSPIDMLAYVDDWQIMFSSPAEFPAVWGALNFVVRELDLQLDHAKSFLWASLSSDRALLRDAPLRVELSARDLGAHQNFCKKAGNKTIIDRISSMQAKWTQLKVCKSPYRFKTRALQQLAWPRALHACSIVSIGSNHYTSLRSGAAKALNANKIGSNPMAHLATVSLAADPEAWTTLQTIKDARILSNQSELRLSLDFASNREIPLPANGPTSILIHRCKNFGWVFGKDGRCYDQFGPFDLFVCSWAELKMRAQCGWPKRLAVEVAHRSSFAGIQYADLALVQKSLEAFGEADRVFLRSALDGTLYCDIGKTKEQRGSSSRCLLCGEIDSFRHRLWECPAFAECRSKSKFIDLIPHLPSCLVCHGWPIMSHAWTKLVGYFDKIGRVDKEILWPTEPLPSVVDLFVDGSCACPQDPRLRFASWAVTIAMPSFSCYGYRKLHSGHLAGAIQSSYRAELTAMLVAFQFASRTKSRIRIWSDNQAAVKLGRQLLRGGKISTHVAHSDLVAELECLAMQLGGRVEVAKVVSHCDHMQALDDAEAWAFWRNSQVDLEAGWCNYNRSTEFWEVWKQAVSSLQFQSELLADIQGVILRVGRLATSKRQSEGIATKPTQQEEPESGDDVGQNREEDTRAWKIPDRLVVKYTQPNVLAVHRWWKDIGLPALKANEKLVWVSGVQLHVDFWCHSGFRGLLSKHHSKWYPSETLVPADIPRGFAARSSMFLRVLTSYWKEHDFRMSHQLVRPTSSVLACWMMAYKLPWPAKRLEKIDAILMATHGRQVVKPSELDGYRDLVVSQFES